MRLTQLCRRKYVAFMLALITIMSVLWTYWIESRIQHDPEIPQEGFHSVERKTKHEAVELIEFLRVKITGIEGNELTRKGGENGLVHTPWSKLAYSVTKANVAEKITEIGLLQRLKEVNNVLT